MRCPSGHRGVLTLALLISTASTAVLAQNRIGAIGPGGSGLDQAIDSGDFPAALTLLDEPTFNALTPAQLRASYDILFFGLVAPNTVNVDWTSRLEPYVAAGGHVIYESPSCVPQLFPLVDGTIGACDSSSLIVYAILGLPDRITSQFINCHFILNSWDSSMSAFLQESSAAGGSIIGLYGMPAGEWGGRIVITGPDNETHAVRGGSGATANMYNLLLNELEWVSHPIEQPIFADGFESGDTSEWMGKQPVGSGE